MEVRAVDIIRASANSPMSPSEILLYRSEVTSKPTLETLRLGEYIRSDIGDWGWYRRATPLGVDRNRHIVLLRDFNLSDEIIFERLGGEPTIWENRGRVATGFYVDGGVLLVLVHHDGWRRLSSGRIIYPAEIFVKTPFGFFSVNEFIRSRGVYKVEGQNIWLNHQRNVLSRQRDDWFVLKLVDIVRLRSSTLFHELGHSLDIVPFLKRDAWFQLRKLWKSDLRYDRGLKPPSNISKLNKRISDFRSRLQSVVDLRWGRGPFIDSLRLILAEESFAWDMGLSLMQRLELEDSLKMNLLSRREEAGRTYDERVFGVFFVLTTSFEEFSALCRTSSWVSSEFAREIDEFIDGLSSIVNRSEWNNFVKAPVRRVAGPTQPDTILANPRRLLDQYIS